MSKIYDEAQDETRLYQAGYCYECGEMHEVKFLNNGIREGNKKYYKVWICETCYCADDEILNSKYAGERNGVK